MGEHIGKKKTLYYNGNMKPMKWNKEKNLKLIEERGISFEEIVEEISRRNI